jgi:hypothetical protein
MKKKAEKFRQLSGATCNDFDQRKSFIEPIVEVKNPISLSMKLLGHIIEFWT